jgi:hypothetical protein
MNILLGGFPQKGYDRGLYQDMVFGSPNGKAGPNLNIQLGGYGNCISLDGVNDYITLPSLVGAGFPTAGTIAFWVYLNGIVATQQLFIGSLVGGNALALQIENPNVAFYYQSNGASKTTMSISATTWVHLAISWDTVGNQIAMYKNGASIYSASQATHPTTYTEFSFGALSGGSRFVGGLYQHIQYFTRVLTSGQISEIYNNGLGPGTFNSTNLQLFCRCGDSFVSGNTYTTDLSGNGNHLQLVNGPTIISSGR